MAHFCKMVFVVFAVVVAVVVAVVDFPVVSDTREPWFEISHKQLLLNNQLLFTVGRMYENIEREAGNGPF